MVWPGLRTGNRHRHLCRFNYRRKAQSPGSGNWKPFWQRQQGAIWPKALQAKIRRDRHKIADLLLIPRQGRATNNGKRSLRPAIIQRKVSNGYRAMWAAQVKPPCAQPSITQGWPAQIPSKPSSRHSADHSGMPPKHRLGNYLSRDICHRGSTPPPTALDDLYDAADIPTVIYPRRAARTARPSARIDRPQARLLRADLVPEAHAPSRAARELRLALRERIFYVRLRTMVKNRVVTAFDRYPEEIARLRKVTYSA